MTARTARGTAAALIVAAPSVMLADAQAATAGVRILSPAEEAVVPAGPVPLRLAVRNARGLRVTVDQLDITGRLRAAGRRRTAVLRGRPVRPGAHWLEVRWREPGRRAARTLARRFMVARRYRPLAVKLSPRRRVLYAAGVVKLRLHLKRGVSLLRARVNGHRVRLPHLGRLWPTATLRLGARHHLRFGRNRVQVLAHDFRRARYDREGWTVVVRRTRPLAAGLAAYRGEAGGRAVRLDGRGARPTRPGRRLSWRWRILRKPRGSRARLVRGSSATPRLPIDVRGRYTLRERVTERPAGRGRGGGTRTTSHLVSVLGDTNAPPIGASLQVDLTQYSKGGGSITIDDAPSAGLPDRYDCASNPTSGANRCVYKMPNPDNATYLLVLDARTLEPKAPIATVGAVCPTDDDLRSAIGPWAGQNVIAILTSAAACVFSSPDSLVDVSGPYTYIFTPTTKPDLGIRSGWYSESPTVGNEIPDERPAEISGYLQKSWPVGSRQASEQYQFVPGNYVAYDTSKAGSPAGQNTMVVAGKEYTSRLPGGATDGFQVLVLDKTLNPMLDTPKAFANGAPVGDMAKLLEQARTTPGVSTVLVQSIGRPSPYSVSANDAWNSAAAQLEQLGGNTDVFLNLKGPDWPRPAGTSGWYSLVAAPDPSCLPSSPLPCESEA
ncbi:MAG TPA: hypothetical protein VE781_04535, partial [Kineosporiaceae bacterium]|nr:hypothetical protein [Kineosporiaceae bacterium]